MNVLLIVGLGHSGTTILDSALGCSPDAVGVGEAFRMVAPDAPRRGPNWQRLRDGDVASIECTCHRTVSSCPVWGPAAGLLASGTSERDSSKIVTGVFRRALEHTPGASWIVESTPAGLDHLSTVSQHDVRVLHVTRDVRSWSASRHRRRHTPLWLSHLVWARRVSSVARAVERSGLPSMRLGYEELALRPEAALGAVCGWLGIRFADEMCTPFDHTSSHIISGNPAVRHDGARRVQYDGRWLSSGRRSFVAALIAAGLAGRNRSMVYSNGIIDPIN